MPVRRWQIPPVARTGNRTAQNLVQPGIGLASPLNELFHKVGAPGAASAGPEVERRRNRQRARVGSFAQPGWPIIYGVHRQSGVRV
jgi:hypothetical protein